MHVKSSSLDPQELRFALLLWDQLVWPSSRNLHLGSGNDETFLESAGVLTRPDYTLNGDQASALIRGQFAAFQEREEKEPGVWAVSVGENSLLVNEGLADEGTGALLQLHRAIPIPKYDVPLVEILEFKQRRRDELWLLRNEIEMLVAAVDAAEDPEQALVEHIGTVDRACADLIRVGGEWQFPVLLSNLKAGFNLNPIRAVQAAYGAWTIARPLGLSAASAAAIAVGAGSTLELKGDVGLRSVKRPANPYRYAYSMHQELR